jgi:hypothetical protein
MANERAGWLFSRTQDLLVWTIPVVFTGVAYVLSLWIRAPEHAVIGRALWATQFILGNTTHVVLTFLLLGARRDILHACQGQAARTIVGSVSTLLLAFFAFWFTREAVPWFANFGTAIAICFATHHTLSQARGIWSLYGLRIQTATGGVPAFPLERRLFSGYVSLGTLLILVRWFFTPAVSSGAAFFPAFPGARAELPAEAILLLLAIWLVYAAAVVVSMRATLGWGVRTPKLVYVLLHLCGVAVTLVSPLWGAVYLGGLHGMEYIFLPDSRHGSAAELGERVRLGDAGDVNQARQD